MKADLTLPENRAAFMAQYIGQNVLGQKKLVHIDINRIDRRISALSLRHISSLTDEEFFEACKCFMGDSSNPNAWNTSTITRFFRHNATLIARINSEDGERIELSVSGTMRYYDDDHQGEMYLLAAYDYLRSIGILIPWRGNSCDELIASGVAVYREERKEGI